MLSNLIALPKLGTLWAEQGGIFVGIIAGETDANGNAIPDYGLIAAPGDAGESKQIWGEYGEEIEGADHINDGLQNTAALVAAESPAALWAHNLELNGFADWYLPAQAELNVCYCNGRQHFAKVWHWSSTQCSADSAWLQTFDGGYQYSLHKNDQGRVRAVRRFVIHSAI